MAALDQEWLTAFTQAVQRPVHAAPLREAALQGQLGDWTKALTATAVAACGSLEWEACAKGPVLNVLPIPGNEYLGMDLMAFPEAKTRWRFPKAVMEFENSKNDDRIAYSLWKVLCVRASLRVVYCYRKSAGEGPKLVQFLQDEVIGTMDPQIRVKLEGRTVVVVGSRGDAETFPYGFFKWWRLDRNTGQFQQMT